LEVAGFLHALERQSFIIRSIRKSINFHQNPQQMLKNSHQIISDPPQNPQRKLGVRQQNAWHMLKFAQLGPPEAAWDTDNLVHFLVGQNPDCVDEMNERHDQVWGNIQL
jgi:hypothetical protein